MDDFIGLRQEILDQAMNLLDSDTVAIEDRYALSVEVAQSKGTFEAYQKAFQLAQQLEADDKLSAYLDLIGIVDAKIEESIDLGNTDQENAVNVQDENAH